MLTDLNGCLALDADSQTDHVWQMEERQQNGQVGIRFQRVRLPRVMRVAYPRDRDDLLARWQEGALILVATDRDIPEPQEEWPDDVAPPPPAQIYAYCQLDALEWQHAGWIAHLVVDRRLRRRGIGSALLRASVAWGRQRKLRRLMVAVQTKNHPAISFLEKHGFGFCGFNDHYFPNLDIALFFSLRI